MLSAGIGGFDSWRRGRSIERLVRRNRDARPMRPLPPQVGLKPKPESGSATSQLAGVKQRRQFEPHERRLIDDGNHEATPGRVDGEIPLADGK